MMSDFYERFYTECGVKPPEKGDQDWEFWAGNYRDTGRYLAFYQTYSAKMDDWQRYLLMNMIVQGIEDLMEYSEDRDYTDLLWWITRDILLKDRHIATIAGWSCIGQELEDAWLITPEMRKLLEMFEKPDLQ